MKEFSFTVFNVFYTMSYYIHQPFSKTFINSWDKNKSKFQIFPTSRTYMEKNTVFLTKTFMDYATG